MLQSGRLRLYGERAGDSEGGRVGPRVRSGDGERKREVEGLKKSAERSVWIHLKYYSILSCVFLKLQLERGRNLHSPAKQESGRGEVVFHQGWFRLETREGY